MKSNVKEEKNHRVTQSIYSVWDTHVTSTYMWRLISLGLNLAFMAYVSPIGWIEVNAKFFISKTLTLVCWNAKFSIAWFIERRRNTQQVYQEMQFKSHLIIKISLCFKKNVHFKIFTYIKIYIKFWLSMYFFAIKYFILPLFQNT